MTRRKSELILAGSLIGFGLLLLPLAIYVVGIQIIGPYEGEGGAFGLLASILGALARGDWAAWVLTLSPYVVVQLGRLGLHLWRAHRVTPVTD
jgi:hypothetical protein